MEYVLFVCDADGKVHEFPGDCFVDSFADSHKVQRKADEGAPECFALFMRGIKWYKYAPAEPSYHIVRNTFHELKIGVFVLLGLCAIFAIVVRAQMG